MTCAEFKAHLLEILKLLHEEGDYIIEGEITLAWYYQRYRAESEETFISLLSKYAEEELVEASALTHKRKLITLSRDEYGHQVELL